jgi:hypothetical protein
MPLQQEAGRPPLPQTPFTDTSSVPRVVVRRWEECTRRMEGGGKMDRLVRMPTPTLAAAISPHKGERVMGPPPEARKLMLWIPSPQGGTVYIGL